MNKSVHKYLAKIGSKGGQTTGPQKARSSEVARAAALKRWAKVDKNIDQSLPACKHPPERLYSWTAYDGVVCVGCCECGASLAGALPA